MSREVQGEAPDDARADPRTLQERMEAGAARLHLSGVVRHTGRRRTALLVALVCLAGGLGGWALAGAWSPATRAAEPDAVTATVRDVVAEAGDRPVPTRGHLLVEVVNASAGTIVVTGHDVSYDAAQITGVVPRILEVPAAASRTLEVDVAVGCTGPAPLRSAPLRLRRMDGGIRPLPVNGASQALTTLCATAGGPQSPLVIHEAHPEGGRLALVMSAPSGRTTEVEAVRAGGVPLVTTQATVAGASTTIWLEPPYDCPMAWRSTGIPQQVSLDVDVGGPASLTLQVGPALADWLLATSCPGGSR